MTWHCQANYNVKGDYMKPERLARTAIYENPWLNLYVDKVRFPQGRIIEKHHVLDFEREAVGVLVEDVEGQILLVHAYRYVTDSIEWEIPAGGIEQGETVLLAAGREVWEESGYETIDHNLIYTFYPMNGIANKVFHIVHAQATRKTGDFDRNEIEEFKWVSGPEIRDMINNNHVRDGFSLVGLMLYLTMSQL
jgi:ADP-ribose pyrophosphatase